MALDEEYPKTFRQWRRPLDRLLEVDGQLTPPERELIATAISSMADKARDLEDIVNRLLNERHSPAEIGELLIAFELTTEKLRGHSDDIDGKLYEIGDRLKGEKAAAKET
jgi:hypothetical protein